VPTLAHHGIKSDCQEFSLYGRGIHWRNGYSTGNYQLINTKSTLRMFILPGITSPGTRKGILPGITSPGTRKGILPGITSPGTRKGILPGITSSFTMIQAGKIKMRGKSSKP
jgi:hypothetical protein